VSEKKGRLKEMLYTYFRHYKIEQYGPRNFFGNDVTWIFIKRQKLIPAKPYLLKRRPLSLLLSMAFLRLVTRNWLYKQLLEGSLSTRALLQIINLHNAVIPMVVKSTSRPKKGLDFSDSYSIMPSKDATAYIALQRRLIGFTNGDKHYRKKGGIAAVNGMTSSLAVGVHHAQNAFDGVKTFSPSIASEHAFG